MSIAMHFKPLFSWGILTLVFMVIYAYVPNVKLKLTKQFPGALFTAISWNLFSWGFSAYIERFNDFGVYGSLSTIIVVMMWLYFCMYLLLVGGTHQPVCCSVSKRDSREIVLTFRDGFFTIRRKGDEGVSSISCTGREEKPVAESFSSRIGYEFPTGAVRLKRACCQCFLGRSERTGHVTSAMSACRWREQGWYRGIFSSLV